MFPKFRVVFSLNVSIKLDITKLDTTKSPYYSIWQAAESCNVFFLKEGHIWLLLTQADLSAGLIFLLSFDLVYIKVAWNHVLFTLSTSSAY